MAWVLFRTNKIAKPLGKLRVASGQVNIMERNWLWAGLDRERISKTARRRPWAFQQSTDRHKALTATLRQADGADFLRKALVDDGLVVDNVALWCHIRRHQAWPAVRQICRFGQFSNHVAGLLDGVGDQTWHPCQHIGQPTKAGD